MPGYVDELKSYMNFFMFVSEKTKRLTIRIAFMRFGF